MRLNGHPARSLEGVVAVVTGGANGIGLATAAELVRRGAVVAIGDVDEAGAITAAAGVGAAMGTFLDVADRPGFTSFLDDVERDLGPLGVLINNAGIMPLGPITEESDATTDRVLAINLHAVIHGTREAARRMVPRGKGHIVNVASTIGKAGLPGGATYSASKFAAIGFSEAVRHELAGTGVHVSVVLPAIVQTELGEGVGRALGIRRVQPVDVANAIGGVLERPRFETYAPWEAGPIATLGGVLPQGMRDALVRAMGLHKTLAEADGNARAAYEERIRNR